MRRHLTLSSTWIAVAALAILGPRHEVRAAGGYTIVDLGDFGGNESYGYDINNEGQVTGYATDDGAFSRSWAFLYSNGVLTNLGVPGLEQDLSSSYGWAINSLGQVAGMYLYCVGSCNPLQYPLLYSKGSITDIGLGFSGGATAINDSGQVAGTLNVTGGSHAFLRSNGVTTDLGALPNLPYASVTAMNSSGQLAGFSTKPNPNYGPHAFLYSNGAMTDLTPYGGDAEGINDSGQVTGYFFDAAQIHNHAYIYQQNGGLTDLGTLGGDSTSSWGFAINAAGQVTGIVDPAVYTGGAHAFLYSEGTMTDLGTLGGLNSSPGQDFYRHSINAKGQVVGTSDTASDGRHAFLYSDGVMTDLNSLIPADSGWTAQVANAINDKGQITGYGRINGHTHAFLMTPDVAAVAPPTIAKAFGAASIPFFTNTTLTFTLQNPNSTSLSGVAFTDPLPAGLIVATPNALTGSCGGTVTAVRGSNSISLTGGTLAASGSCVFSVNVTALDLGLKMNRTFNITSTESGAGTNASAGITVLSPPSKNCFSQTNSSLAHLYGSMSAAARALGFPSVQALHDAIQVRCGG
jgi:probable HAF family extracellular repeat protein